MASKGSVIMKKENKRISAQDILPISFLFKISFLDIKYIKLYNAPFEVFLSHDRNNKNPNSSNKSGHASWRNQQSCNWITFLVHAKVSAPQTPRSERTFVIALWFYFHRLWSNQTRPNWIYWKINHYSSQLFNHVILVSQNGD